MHYCTNLYEKENQLHICEIENVYILDLEENNHLTHSPVYIHSPKFSIITFIHYRYWFQISKLQ